MFNFTKLMKFDARVVVAEDILNEDDAVVLVSEEFANKIGVKDGKYIKLTREKSVCFCVKVSEFAEGVDIVIPSGFFANQLTTLDETKQFVAEVEICDKKSKVDEFL